MNDEAPDLTRRFGGVARLYGTDALQSLNRARVAVVGLGGVGSWVAEALARSAVGGMTLVDLDMVAESNVNRQVHALDAEFGRAKVSVMAQRLRAINPACAVTEIEDFVTPENVDALLDERFDFVVDAIDQVWAKAAMIAWSRRRRVPLITAGGAGGQVDPTRIQIADLALTVEDPLLARVRSLLRRDYGFPRLAKQRFGVPAVFSSEPLRRPVTNAACPSQRAGGGLNCAGMGSSVCVTATFGLLAAAEVIKGLVAAKSVARPM